MGAGRPLAGARGSAAARAPLASPPWPPRQAAPSRRPLPSPAASPPRQARRARPGPSWPVAGSAPRSLTRCASPRRPVPAEEPRGSPEPLFIRRPWIRPHVVLPPREPQGHAWAVKWGVRTVPPRSATCPAPAVHRLQAPGSGETQPAAQVLQSRCPDLVFPTFRATFYIALLQRQRKNERKRGKKKKKKKERATLV